MKYQHPDEEEPAPSNQDSVNPDYCRFQQQAMALTVNQLLQLDCTRTINYARMRADEDPTIDDLINGEFSIEEPTSFSQSPAPPILSELSFFGIWTSVEFHNRLDFMAYLNPADKKILIKNFAVKSFLLFSAFRCFIQKNEKLVNPDGSELFPPCVRKFVVIRKLIIS